MTVAAAEIDQTTPDAALGTCLPYAPRYRSLDALRGVAAVTVVVAHIGGAPYGWSAVMLFFVISGYCIAAAGETAANKGLGFVAFMRRRIHRIYPPYLFAVAWFAITRLIKASMTGENDLARSFTGWVQNLTLTQWLTLVSHPGKSPLNNPTTFVTAFWSLNYEEQFYLVVAILLLLPTRQLRMAVMFALMPLSLLWRIAQPFDFHGLFIEYWLHFGFGCVVFWRLCRARPSIMTRAIDAAVLASALASTFLFFHRETSTGVPLLILEMPVVTWFALFLIAIRRYDEWLAASAIGRMLAPLGAISYSLYLIHENNLKFCSVVAGRLVSTDWPMLNGACQLMLHLTIATAFWYFCERPFLNSRLANSPRDPAVETPAMRPI